MHAFPYKGGKGPLTKKKGRQLIEEMAGLLASLTYELIPPPPNSLSRMDQIASS